MKIPIFNECQDKVYRRDISDYDHVTYDPLLRDPYETKMVDVRQSAVEGTTLAFLSPVCGQRAFWWKSLQIRNTI